MAHRMLIFHDPHSCTAWNVGQAKICSAHRNFPLDGHSVPCNSRLSKTGDVMTADELAKCKRVWETIREMENPARQSIAVALWTGLYAEELLRAAEMHIAG